MLKKTSMILSFVFCILFCLARVGAPQENRCSRPKVAVKAQFRYDRELTLPSPGSHGRGESEKSSWQNSGRILPIFSSFQWINQVALTAITNFDTESSLTATGS